MTERCRFDDSLPWLLDTLTGELGQEKVTAGTVLRDATGRLAFFAAGEVAEDAMDRASARVRDRLGAYARPDRVIADSRAPGAAAILADPTAVQLSLRSATIRYVDRRIVGADWQEPPANLQAQPPRFVFASLKGGVGRSTAMSVVAADLAQRGRNVLVVDLDLEAPGIGSMLLSDDLVPEYGVLDYLVEANLEPFAPEEIDALSGSSPLTAGAGLVNVAPVVGRRTKDAPETFLAKLSRAMLEGVTPDGERVSLRDKVRRLLADLEARRQYDVTLVDARAGLAELTAGPLLGLGATTLLFGTAQRQTLDGVRILLAHLQSLEAKAGPFDALKMVHAKAQQESAHLRFKDDLWELFSEYLYEEQSGIEGFNFGPDDPAAPHNAIPIPLDAAFADWDPIVEPSKLVAAYYERGFGALLTYMTDLATVDRA